jgi:multiple sugar transport system permease protein
MDQLTRTEQARVGSPAARARGRAALSDEALKRLFLWPTLLLLIAFNIFPLLYSLYLSFTDYSAIANQPPNWIGLRNYQEILGSSQLWTYFRTTGLYVLLSVGLETIVGFGLALLLRRKFWGSGLITTLILVPMMLSPVVVGLFWKLIYNPTYGIFNYLIGFTNPATAPDWLGDPRLALLAVVIVDVWMWAPYVMLLCLAGLSAIPDYLYEAAEIDRAGPLFTFFRVTLPMVAPLLLIAVLFRTIEAFKTFDLVMGLTSGGPGDATELVAVNLYRIAFPQWQTGKASALAYIVLVIIIGVSNIYVKYLNQIKDR